MPELPEVETTRRGVAPHVAGQTVAAVVVRQRQLRYAVPAALQRELPGQVVEAVARRGKYLLLITARGTVIIHLGMSGSLRLAAADRAAEKHDHVDIVFTNGRCLRLRDPRRFGCVLWTRGDAADHKLIRGLGIEPLEGNLSGETLYQRSRGRRSSVKAFLMDSRVLVGVGNIYASEALFRARIHPRRAAGRISLARYQRLAEAVRTVLESAIEQGGTTLRDFTASDGRPGYFKQRLSVYDRAGQPCITCGSPIAQQVIAQRSSYYCNQCQR